MIAFVLNKVIRQNDVTSQVDFCEIKRNCILHDTETNIKKEEYPTYSY